MERVTGWPAAEGGPEEGLGLGFSWATWSLKARVGFLAKEGAGGHSAWKSGWVGAGLALAEGPLELQLSPMDVGSRLWGPCRGAEGLGWLELPFGTCTEAWGRRHHVSSSEVQPGGLSGYSGAPGLVGGPLLVARPRPTASSKRLPSLPPTPSLGDTCSLGLPASFKLLPCRSAALPLDPGQPRRRHPSAPPRWLWRGSFWNVLRGEASFPWGERGTERWFLGDGRTLGVCRAVSCLFLKSSSCRGQGECELQVTPGVKRAGTALGLDPRPAGIAGPARSPSRPHWHPPSPPHPAFPACPPSPSRGTRPTGAP